MAPVLLVDTPAALERFSNDWLPRIDDAVVAVDIEEERGQTYHPRVALVQISVGGSDAILDPIALGHKALEPAIEQVLLASKLVILHGGRNDVAGLRRDFGVGPRMLGDTQIAARFLGQRQFGLSALLQDRFGITLDKEERRSDWAQRPLTASQIAYAQGDTHYLEALWHELRDDAFQHGWGDAVEEECAALGDVPADNASFDPLGWLKIKGIGQRDEATRRRATTLWWWRDQLGQKYNLHPSQLLPNWAVEQAAIRGIEWIQTQNQLASKLLAKDPYIFDTLENVLSAHLDLPTQRPRERKNLSLVVSPDAMRLRHDALNQWRDACAERTGMEPGWLAPRSVLEEVARVQPDTLETLADASDVRTWRLNRFADEWRAILKRHR